MPTPRAPKTISGSGVASHSSCSNLTSPGVYLTTSALLVASLSADRISHLAISKDCSTSSAFPEANK